MFQKCAATLAALALIVKKIRAVEHYPANKITTLVKSFHGRITLEENHHSEE